MTQKEAITLNRMVLYKNSPSELFEEAVPVSVLPQAAMLEPEYLSVISK